MKSETFRYLNIHLYELQDLESMEDDFLEETIPDEGEPLSDETNVERLPVRTISVFLSDGIVRIESVSDDAIQSFKVELNEQLSNEFLIQTELLRIKEWNPLYYSPAYSGGYRCSWVLEYEGLKGDNVVHSGDGKYPKAWETLMDLIDSMNDHGSLTQETLRIAGDYADEAFGVDVADTMEVVHLLTQMKMPQEVIAAGIFHEISKVQYLDMEYIGNHFDRVVIDLLGEFGDESDLSPDEQKIALIEKVRASESLYFKRLVLAEVLSDIISIKAKLDAGLGFDESVLEKDDLGVYYAEMISALGKLEGDPKAGALYSRLVDLYKTVFVSYYLDSVGGVIYQTQGTMAGVMIKRGDYDWHAISGNMSPSAQPLSKETALYLAKLWRHEADEVLVRDGNKAGDHDVSDIKVLKIIMEKVSRESKGKSKARKAEERKDNETALSVLKRMILEEEQIFAPLRATEPDLELIQNSGIEDVNQVAVSFLGLEDDEGKTMAAVFTSMDELGEIDGSDIEAIPVKMLFEFVKSMSRLDGLIIDPFSDRFTISKEKIAEVLDEIKKENNDAI